MLARLRRIKSIGLFISVLCVSVAISTHTNQDDFGMVTSGRKKFYLTRIHKSKDRTLGTLTIPGATSPILYTLEPPQRVKKPRTIPAGTYVVEVQPQPAPALPRLHLLAVEGFSNVYIEVGNFPRNTRGCVLVGTTIESEELRGSQKAYQIILDSLNNSLYFILVISDEQPTSKPVENPVQNGTRLPLHFLPTRLN